MSKIKGKLNIKTLNGVSEAKISKKRSFEDKDKDILKSKTSKKRMLEDNTDHICLKKKDNLYEPPHLKFPYRWLYIVVFILLFFGTAASIYFGLWESGDINISDLTAKDITININSQPQKISTNAKTVGELLEELNIDLGPSDFIDKKRDQLINEGMKIWLRLSIPIQIIADNQVISFESQPITVAKALEINGIELEENDKVSQPLLSYIYKESKIIVFRTETKIEVVEEFVDQQETTVEYSYLASGSRVIISEGSPGVKRNTYEVTYQNGEEIERELISTEKVRDPVKRVVGVGTKISSSTSSKNIATTEEGIEFYYINSYSMEATAYTWTGNRTATGTWPKVGTVAVDPNIISLGSKVYVTGYGFAVAEDTGGAIKNYIIDLYMDNQEECINWGRRQVTVYVLE